MIMFKWSVPLFSTVITFVGAVTLETKPQFLYLGNPNANAITEYTEGVDFLSSNAPRVVEFYSPYCHACINFAPKYMEMATSIKADHPEVEFYAVSCKAHHAVCRAAEVRGYPSINVYQAGSKEGTYVRHIGGSANVVKALNLDEKDDADIDRKLEDSASDTEVDIKIYNSTGAAESGYLPLPTAPKQEVAPLAMTSAKAETPGGEDDEMEVSEDEDEKTDDDDAVKESGESDEKPLLASNPILTRPNPGAGAQLGQKAPRDMDRWKEIIAAKKQSLEIRKGGRLGGGGAIGILPTRRQRNVIEKQAEPGLTNIMKSNTPGTPEFTARMKALRERIDQDRKARGIQGPQTKGAGPDPPVLQKDNMPLVKELKKPAFIRKQAEKIPVIKRIFKMSPEEELILDASLSFVNALKFDTFVNDDPLTSKKKDALKSWFDLLTVSLPPEWGLHELIGGLSDNLDFISQSQVNLSKIIDKYPLPRDGWSPSCQKGSIAGGFTCGMWKLYHVLTIGIAEHRGGLNLVEAGVMNSGTRIFSPLQAADTLREYIAHFMGCVKCRNHFIAQYDQCSNRRCDRLKNTAEGSSPDDWKELALWLWEVHNSVSVRVANEKAERMKSEVQVSKMDDIKALYPPLETCFLCVNADSTWNENTIFEFLEKTYWAAPDPKTDRLLRYKRSETDVSGSGYIWFFMMIALATVIKMKGFVFTKVGQRTMNAAVVAGRSIGGKKRSV